MTKKARYPRLIEQARLGDREIAALAGRQHGFVTRAQLTDHGISRHTIARRVAAGRLIRAYAGVYAVGHVPAHPHDRAFGAVLACGPRAVLSHDTAACVWAIYRRWTRPLHVTARSGHGHQGVTVHRAKLGRRDITRQLGLPVTSPARTLLDLAPQMAPRTLTRAVNDLRRSAHLSLDDLADVLARFPRHPGARRLRRFVEFPTGPTASEFEDVFQAFTDHYNLPRPLINVVVAGHEADAYFPVERVVVELDGWDFHSSRESFSEDRERDADRLAVGIVTDRITWERLTLTPDREAERMVAILERRRPRAP